MQDMQEILQFFLAKGIIAGRQDAFAMDIGLEKIGLISLEPLPDLTEIFRLVQTTHCRGAEFMGKPAGTKEKDGFLYACHVQFPEPCSPDIVGGRGLNIHGYIVKEPLLVEHMEDFRMIPVGIQFDEIPKGFQFLQKGEKIRLQSGFPSRNADASENPPPFFENPDYLFLGYGRKGTGVQYQVAVLTKRTAKIASARKNGGGHTAGKIQESCFLKTIYLHLNLPARFSGRKFMVENINSEA